MSISVVNDPNLPNELYELLLRRVTPANSSSILPRHWPTMSEKTSAQRWPSISQKIADNLISTAAMVDSIRLRIFGKMVIELNEHLRHCLLYLYDKGVSAQEAATELNQVYGAGTVSNATVFRWFARFRSGDRSLKNVEGRGRPQTFDEGRLQRLLEEDNKITIRGIQEEMGGSLSTIHEHLKKLGYTSKLGVWVPHELSPQNKANRSRICQELLQKFEDSPFFDRIVTMDECWCLYENPVRKRSWVKDDQKPSSTPKPKTHGEKRMLVVFWDCQGIIYREFLPKGTSFTADLYCQILDRLRVALNQNRPGKGPILLQQDNARPHIAKTVKAKIESFGWELLPHPAYSPDLAPSDYHLFLSWKNFLRGKKLQNMEELEQSWEEFVSSKDPLFFARGIEKLPDKWQLVVDLAGDYFIDE